MSMSQTYTEKILEEVLKEFLADDTIPTADQLAEAYNVRVASHPDLGIPFLSDEDHLVAENSDSSAASFNSFFERTQSDLQALYTEIWDRTADGMESFERWRIELELLEKRLIDLENRIDALLLLRIDTTGYFAHVEDNLVDFSKIDLTNTTAKVDASNHTATIARSLDNTTPLPAYSIPYEDALFTVLTRENLMDARDATDTNIGQALANENTYWQHRVRTTIANKPMSGELKVKLADVATDISRVELTLHSSNTNSRITLTGMYSLDDYTWYNMPTENYVQSTDTKAVFLFESTSIKWVKFIMTKTGPDDVDRGQYVYEFGASQIAFYDDVYDSTGSVFWSSYQSAYDPDDARIPFDKVALETCQSIPTNTSIAYWIVASNGTDTTGELRIDPHTADDIVAPTIVNLSQLSETTEDTLYVVAKTQTDSKNFFGAYKNAIKSDRLAIVGDSVSSAYELSASVASGMIEDSLIFYRNVGPAGGTTNLIREAPLGWHYDNTKTYLMTTLVVDNQDGLEVDFGNNAAILNGTPVTHRTTIPYGTSTFKTLTTNTASLSSLGPFSDEASLSAVDSLYPYNHRTIIEGADYATAYIEDKYYLGVDKYCQHIAQRISIFDLMNNTADTDFARFSIDTMPSGTRVFAIRFDPDDTNPENEMFALEFSTGDNIFNRIKIKAQLSSSDTGISPVLTAYRIKLGV